MKTLALIAVGLVVLGCGCAGQNQKQLYVKPHSSLTSLQGNHFFCENYNYTTGKTSGCRAINGATLDDSINEMMVYFAEMQKRNTACGTYADWTLDQNGNVMYRVQNASCPKTPKPIGYGNYCDLDLAAIGKGDLPEEARPRTLGCK